MAQDQRAFKRFDLFSVIECKPLNQLNKSPFYGIMKNFSYGGFSMETQYNRLEPGERLEFRLKDPKSNEPVTDAGEIVWKDTASKFKCRMGIKFGDEDVENRIKMLEIAAVSGGIPVDFFLSEEPVDNGKAEAPEADTDASFSAELREQMQSGVVQEDIELVNPDHTDTEVGSGENAEEEPAPEEALEDMDNTLERETDQGDDDMASHRERPGGGKKWIYVVVTLVAAAVLGYILSPIYEKKGDELETREMPAGETDTLKSGIIKPPVPVTSELPPAEELIKPIESVRSVTLRPVVPPVQTRGPENYFIQAGAWKNPVYAREMLTKLKKRYPGTYMIDENGFHKIRIPGIRSESEGNNMIKALQQDFRIRPLLVAQKQR